MSLVPKFRISPKFLSNTVSIGSIVKVNRLMKNFASILALIFLLYYL